MSEPTEPAPRTSSGAGRALVAVYGLFALAATARAGVQLATRYDEAPLAYLLSAVAGVIYVVATVTLARGGWASSGSGPRCPAPRRCRASRAGGPLAVSPSRPAGTH